VAEPHSIRVLYVEDDEIIRSVACEALRDTGFEVIQAKSADEAILLLNEPNPVSALVTDIRLPGTMDGIDLAHATRKAYPNMPVVVASGYAAQIRERLRDLNPPMVFMSKPFSLDTMVANLRKLTEGL